jgi:hypothetical protein
MRKERDPTFDVGFLFVATKVTRTRRTNLDHSCCGRGDAHQRIHLYPVESRRLRTIIGIHVSRSPKGTAGDQTITGFRRTINLPGHQPPHRRCGKLISSFALITLSALRLLG